MRHFSGYVYKEKRGNRVYWIARLTVTDAEGRRRNLKTSAATKTEARLKLDRLKIRARSIAGGAAVDADQMTFAELAQKYAAIKLVPAEYRGEKKVRGLRSLDTYQLFLTILTSHFGKRRIRAIRHAEIESFRNLRLDTLTRTGQPRSVASVNRELGLLRTILIWAGRQGWIEKNPFHGGDPLIRRSEETKRNRIINFEEEERLLAACHDSRAHLRPLIIAAIDTGMRRGELFKLVWSDVDLMNHRIHIRAKNAKTGKARTTIITDRLAERLRQLRDAPAMKPDDLVFGLTNNVRHGFTSACREAGLDDLHFHDLRHVFVSRTAMAGMLPTVSMKLAGHETLEMHSRYLNPDEDSETQAREALNRLYRERGIITSELVN